AAGNDVSVLLGNGDGTFQPARPYPVGSAPHSLTLGDFNGDGRLDLATANSTGNSVAVLLGNGDGSFTTGTVSSFSVSVFQGSGSLAAGTVSSQAFGFPPVSVVAADLNGDGTLDL